MAWKLSFRIGSDPADAANAAKALATCIIVALISGMCGKSGQIVVHDIIPTFTTESAVCRWRRYGGSSLDPADPGGGSGA